MNARTFAKTLSSKEALKRLGISRRTLHRYAERGLLTPVKLNARVIRWKTAEIDALAGAL